MNTNALAKRYDGLTPWERLPLITAASGRGDETERQRLMRTAPTVVYRVPDYFGLGMAFNEVSRLHFMELLNLAALYFETMAHADDWEDEYGERMLKIGRLFGYIFKVQLAGWRAFCAEFYFDPEPCWDSLPGFETVKRMESAAESAAFTPEEVAAYFRKRGQDKSRIITYADVATCLRECLKERADWWG
jgi:hypothetical protein